MNVGKRIPTAVIELPEISLMTVDVSVVVVGILY